MSKHQISLLSTDPASMAKIAISYRGKDPQEITSRIFDRLTAHYGHEAILRDISDVPPGADFRQHISDKLREATVLLVLVGPEWLGIDGQGRERIDEEYDPVRIEVETALRRRVPIIPVLIGDTRMPDSHQLPPSLKDFAFRNAVKVDAGQDFDYHMDRLIRALDAALAQAAKLAPAAAPLSHASVATQEHETGSRSAAVAGALPIAALKRRREQLRRIADNSGLDDLTWGKPARSARPRRRDPTVALSLPDGPMASRETARPSEARAAAPGRGSSAQSHAAPAPAAPPPSPVSSRQSPRSPSRAGRPGLAILLGAMAALAVAGYVWRQELALAAGAILKLLGLASMPPMPAEKTQAEGDLVDASVFAPASGRAGDAILVQVFLHTLEAAQSAAELANEADSAAARRGVTTLDINVKRGQRVDIVLDAPGLTIDEPDQFLIWRGEPRSCQFVVGVPAEQGGRTFQVKARMLVGSVPVGTLRFTLKATAAEATAPIDMVGEAAHRYRQAFLSHSHDDRVKVLTYAQLLEAAGIRYFQDIASLRVMDNWEPRLHEAIEQCDLFLLFWTASAARSEWVERETRYALARQTESGRDLPDVMPIFLEPDAPRPPEWLKCRHFDSLLRLAMRGAAADAEPRSNQD